MYSPGLWQGVCPPQYLYAQRQFRGIALDPPEFSPGSWIGAGKALYDHLGGQYLLTARPRKAAGGVRGYAANIYRSADGEHFSLLASLSKQDVMDLSGVKAHSIEGTQLLRDPLTGRWHFYLSVDTGDDFVWGGIHWETLLLTAADLTGPWRSEGLVLRTDQENDAYQARDSTIDIIDGRWYCLYKAINRERQERPALATSADGIAWRKHGVLTIDGADTLTVLSGTLVAGTGGPLFLGIERELDDSRTRKAGVVYADQYGIGHGGGPRPKFAAFLLDYHRMNLERLCGIPGWAQLPTSTPSIRCWAMPACSLTRCNPAC